MYYSIEEMQACTNQLSAILEVGITEESLNQFADTVLNLNWQGAAAEIYRTEVMNTIAILRSQLSELESLAIEPLKKAQLMQQADKQEAQRIRNTFLI